VAIRGTRESRFAALLAIDPTVYKVLVCCLFGGDRRELLVHCTLPQVGIINPANFSTDQLIEMVIFGFAWVGVAPDWLR